MWSGKQERSRRGAPWLASLVAFAALAGCGTSGPKPGGPAGRLTPATKTTETSSGRRTQAVPSFERTANRVCADAGSKITALPPLSRSDFLSQTRYEQELIRGVVARLKTLRPPEAKRRGFARFLSDTAAQPGIIDDAISALRKRRAGEARTLLKRLAAKGESADRAAASIGLADCARDYSPVPHPTA